MNVSPPESPPNIVAPPRRMMAAIRPIRLTPPPGRGGGTAPGKYSARNHNQPVKFYCVAPGAASVCLVSHRPGRCHASTEASPCRDGGNGGCC